jgi:Fe-S cluster assembly protein SufD
MTTIQMTWLEEQQANAVMQRANAPVMQRQKQDVGKIELVESLSASRSEIIIEAPEEVVCTTLENTNEEQFELLKEHLGKIILPTTNVCTVTHYENVKDIILVHIPANKEITTPIRIKKQAQGNAFHHVLIVAEPSSKAWIIEEETSNRKEEEDNQEHKNTNHMSTVVEVIVKQNAELTYTCIQDYDTNCQHYVNKKASVYKDGTMHWVEAYFGSNYANSNISAELKENGAESTNTTIFFGENTQRFDIRSQTHQFGTHTNADMNAIGVVRDYAKSMCNGLIKIEKESYGSQGHQKAKTLLMNRNAQANAIPSMEIDNFDVRATHEASVGQINKNQLFYMMSRGLNEQEARSKIVEGFFTPIIDNIKSEETQEKVRELIAKKLHQESKGVQE